MEGYNVVLRNRKGITTWTTFQSKEAFNAYKSTDTIVAEGISNIDAISLCEKENAPIMETILKLNRYIL